MESISLEFNIAVIFSFFLNLTIKKLPQHSTRISTTKLRGQMLVKDHTDSARPKSTQWVREQSVIDKRKKASGSRKCSAECIHCCKTSGYQVIYNDEAIVSQRDDNRQNKAPLILAYSMGGGRMLVRI